jgi:isopenicillin N synthase-like dioxygenase
MEQPLGGGVFVPADSGGPHECIINVGDCLQLWMGLHSARHRVHMPPAKNERHEGDLVRERFSVAYFFQTGSCVDPPAASGSARGMQREPAEVPNSQ